MGTVDSGVVWSATSSAVVVGGTTMVGASVVIVDVVVAATVVVVVVVSIVVVVVVVVVVPLQAELCSSAAISRIMLFKENSVELQLEGAKIYRPNAHSSGTGWSGDPLYEPMDAPKAAAVASQLSSITSRSCSHVTFEIPLDAPGMLPVHVAIALLRCLACVSHASGSFGAVNTCTRRPPTEKLEHLISLSNGGSRHRLSKNDGSFACAVINVLNNSATMPQFC